MIVVLPPGEWWKLPNNISKSQAEQHYPTSLVQWLPNKSGLQFSADLPFQQMIPNFGCKTNLNVSLS